MLLHLPLPVGLPGTETLTSLADVYWPSLEWPWEWPEPSASPPNIWFFRFTLAYALAFTVLERITANTRQIQWTSALTVAALIGFAGLLDEAVALTTLGIWGVVATAQLASSRSATARRIPCIRCRRSASRPSASSLRFFY